MKHAAIEVDQAQQLQSLLDAMLNACQTPERPVKVVAAELQAAYREHCYVAGTFSEQANYVGPILVFVGTVCGEQVSHRVQC